MATVALVGRPNVGKSTLFNRIAAGRYAITDDQPGVTRDRLYAVAEWLTRRFELIDTGGLTMASAPFQKEIAFQVSVAVDESDLVVLVLAAGQGVTPDDRHVARLLKKAHKQSVVVCINKSDTKHDPNIVSEAITLGYGEPIMVSAEHGMGVGDLLDRVVTAIDPLLKEEKSMQDGGTKLAVLGKPNVGKSTLVNALVGEQRAIVSPIAGTTRDSTDTSFTRNKERFTIIDTAGIRRKGAVEENVEKYSVLRAHRALARCDLALIVIDASQEVDHQDMIVAGLAHQANLPTIIVANKWDAVTKDSQTMVQEEKKLRLAMQYLAWAPIVFISAANNQRIDSLFEAVATIRQEAQKKLPIGLLREVIAKAQITNNPPRVKGRRIEIFDVQQSESRIPTFTLFCNDPELLHFSFSRYVENVIREAFGLTHVPMTLYFKPFGRTRKKKTK